MQLVLPVVQWISVAYCFSKSSPVTRLWTLPESRVADVIDEWSKSLSLLDHLSEDARSALVHDLQEVPKVTESEAEAISIYLQKSHQSGQKTCVTSYYSIIQTPVVSNLPRRWPCELWSMLKEAC